MQRIRASYAAVVLGIKDSCDMHSLLPFIGHLVREKNLLSREEAVYRGKQVLSKRKVNRSIQADMVV